MKKNSNFIDSIFLTLLIPFLLGNGEYTLPVPNGGDKVPSPPSIIGILKGVSNDEVNVLPQDTKQPLIVKYTTNTMIFTKAGGYVWPERLVIDGPVEIWFTHDTFEKKLNPPVAAVIRVERRKVP